MPNKSKFYCNYINGVKEGPGRATWADGNSYEGDFSANRIHGQGTYTWLDGRTYSGQWLENKMNGYGEMKWADGRSYAGNYKND